MATILLITIYVAFIGLGIPDSLFGTAWPAIYRELALPVSAAGYITLLLSGCTVLSSLLSARLINRFGTGMVTAVSTVMTAAALFGFSLANHVVWICLLAVPLGIGAGAVDSALNNYVALHYKATHMNFLHCFYGVGVTISPYLMSLALAHQNNWHSGYRTAFYIQAGIALLTVITLPLWGKVNQTEAAEQDAAPRTVAFSELLKMPAVRAVWGMFIGSCAIEYICGTWGSTFLVNAKGLPVETAARIITLYYAGMALGRFLSGVLAARLSSWNLIHIGQCAVFAAIILLFLPLPPVAAGIALFMIGVGNGPVFPNLIHLTPKNFGKDISQSVMGSQMAAAYTGIMLMPPLFGFFAQAAGLDIFPYFLFVMFCVMLFSMFFLIRKLKQQKRYEG